MNYKEILKTKFNEKGQEIGDPTPEVVEVEIKTPETISDIVRKHALKQQYMQNLVAVANRQGAGEDIDDEFESDEEAFTAAELAYQKAQEELKAKKEAYFKANEEKVASELAKRQAEHKEKIRQEAIKAGLITPEG